MKSIVIVIVAIVVSLVMGYLLLACKRSLWPFTKKESFGGVIPGTETAGECRAQAGIINRNAANSPNGAWNGTATTSWSNNKCTVTCPSGSKYLYSDNYCYNDENLT